MIRKTGMRRLAQLGSVAVPALAAAALPWSPAGVAQEREEEGRAGGPYRSAEATARTILGVYMVDVPGEGGLRVARVMDGWPAEEAGIRKDDIVVSIDGHRLVERLEDEEEGVAGGSRLTPVQRLRALLREAPEGEAVEVTVERDGESLTFAVVPRTYVDAGPLFERLQAWMDSPDYEETMELARGLNERIREQTERFRQRYDRIRERPPFHGPARGVELRWHGARWPGAGGLDLVELNPGLGSYFGTEEGVLVADVEDDSPLGLRPGDVVVAVGGRRVDDIADLHRILGSYEDDEEIRFRIRRDGAEKAVAGTIN